jgi:O-antigen/teichoic acid export membrane protein
LALAAGKIPGDTSFICSINGFSGSGNDARKRSLCPEQNVSIQRLSGAGLLIVAVPAPEILELYGGSGYNVGGSMLRIVMAAVFVMSLAHYFRMSFLVNRSTNTLLPVGVISAVLSVVSNLTLVPIFGSVGSAIALLVSYSLMLLMSIYHIKKTARIKLPMEELSEYTSAGD